ncbi:MAG: hypothetical protein GY842_26095 [bacterium]|nr:hypothetical protein [bacterium]
MSKRSYSAFVGTPGGLALTALVAGSLMGWGCGAPQAGASSGSATSSKVYIVSTENLESAPLGPSDSWAPSRWISVGSEDTTSPRMAEFFLTVATDRPESLKIRLVPAQSDSPVRLRHVAPPTTPAGTSSLDSRSTGGDGPASDGSRLQDGGFWLAEGTAPTTPLYHRIGVQIAPSAMSANTWLEVYVSETSTGEPIHADRIKLTRGFFYMAVVGDSAMWGNGLREGDKFSTRVARRIEEETGQEVVRFTYAISGAEIVPKKTEEAICGEGCMGEVPSAVTSITRQVENMLHPEEMDLILLDGCGNDVNMKHILSPQTDPVELEETTRRYCGAEMIGLLEKVRSRSPQAPIVVTGYFPFVSEESVESGAEEMALALGIAGEDLEGSDDPLGAMARNSAVFHRVSGESLAAAVAALNASGPGAPLAAFADPGYGPENSIFAPESWLWNLTANPELEQILGIELRLFPEDPLLDYRLEACREPGVAIDLIPCVYGSVAHPNPAGARAYTDAVVDALRQLEVLPASAASDTP